MRASVIASRVPKSVREILIMHAADCERTLSTETRLWLQFGAASVVHAALHQPGTEATAEVAQARADMSRYLAELLPHAVIMPTESLLPALSMN